MPAFITMLNNLKSWSPLAIAIVLVLGASYFVIKLILENRELKQRNAIKEDMAEVVTEAEKRINSAADSRIEVVNTKLDGIETKVDGLETSVKTLDGRVHELALKA